MGQHLCTTNWPHNTNELESTISLHQSLQLPPGVATYPVIKDKPLNGFPSQVLGRPGGPILGVSTQCDRCSPPMGLHNHSSFQRDKGNTPHLCNISQAQLVLRWNTHQCYPPPFHRYEGILQLPTNDSTDGWPLSSRGLIVVPSYVTCKGNNVLHIHCFLEWVTHFHSQPHLCHHHKDLRLAVQVS